MRRSCALQLAVETMTAVRAVKPILPTKVGKAGIPYAQGMAAGPWVFATGHMAQAYPGGLDTAVERAGLPHGGLPKNQKEADLIFSRIQAVLRKAGTDDGAMPAKVSVRVRPMVTAGLAKLVELVNQ